MAKKSAIRMTLNERIKFRVSIYCDIAIFIVLLATMLILRFSLFSGIADSDIDYVVYVGDVPYKVTNLVKPKDTKQPYEVTLESAVEDAPTLSIEPSDIPAGMEVDSEYMAHWAHVAGVYDTHAVVRDKIILEYSGGEITEELLTAMKKEIHSVLKSQYSKAVQPSFLPCAWVIFAIGVLLFSLVSRLSNKFALKIAEPSPWDVLDERLNAVTHDIGTGRRILDCKKNFGDVIDTIPYPSVNCRFWADEQDYARYVSRMRNMEEMRAEHMQYDSSTEGIEAKAAATPLLGGSLGSFDINDPVSNIQAPARTNGVRGNAMVNRGASNPMSSFKKQSPMMPAGKGMHKSSASGGLGGRARRTMNTGSMTMNTKSRVNANLDFTIDEANQYAKSQEIPLMSGVNPMNRRNN